MNSFIGISKSQTTNLAVVAPGIAEALFATAIGLVAAIPAVIAYNQISTALARFASRLESFGSEFSAILSRQSEEKA
jgi:biopolymer transport protein TolQ